MKQKIIRGGFFCLGAYVGVLLFSLIYAYAEAGTGPFSDLNTGQKIGMTLFLAMVCGGIFYKASNFFTGIGSKIRDRIVEELRGVSAAKLLFGMLGLILGFIIAFLLSLIYIQIKIDFLSTGLTVITYIISGYMGVALFSDRGTELMAQLSFEKRITGIAGKIREKKGAAPKIIDTSVIIDGRIRDVLKSGFIEGPIVIPEFVLEELQHIADSSDPLRRRRGRRGLDVLKEIRDEFEIEVYSEKAGALDEIPEVDLKLLKLAQIIKGKVVTNDFNLSKVAEIRNVEVLNINQLANCLKPIVLPEEILEVRLVREGKSGEQALAYLDDGTMIVVEEGRRHIGEDVKVRISSVLQNQSGRMIFGRFAGTAQAVPDEEHDT